MLNVKFKREGRSKWTAECVELGTATFGRTIEEAKKHMEEAIPLHIKTLEDVGEKERFFKEHHVESGEKFKCFIMPIC